MALLWSWIRSAQLVNHMQPELKVRKILGKTYLNENRLAEALDVFSRILMDYPDDLETLNLLGNFYLASGDGKTARNLYLRAKKIDPANQLIQRHIQLAEELGDNSPDGEPVPTDFPAVSRLLQRLTGTEQSVSEEDVLRAAELLEKIIDSESPAEMVARHLDDIDELLPALLELNIRQARSDGRTDLAESLRNLQINIGYQLISKGGDGSAQSPHPTTPRIEGSILFLLPDLDKVSSRMALLRSALEAQGCQVSVKGRYAPGRDAKPAVAVTSNPHTNPVLLESLSALSVAGVPIILDLDADFEKQPASHPEYDTKGLGSQSRSKAYDSAISLSRVIMVPSEMQASSLKTPTHNVCVIPDGWSDRNKLWDKDPHPRSTINIGWVGVSGQLEDLLMIRRFIIRIVREFSNTRIVIVGNPQAYRLFENLPENRRMYLPEVAHEEFPYLLSQMDVLLVPLRTIPYNTSLPDTILVEAGAKGVPWIASPIASFRRWQAGGIITETVEEWHLSLRHLVMDDEYRLDLGRQGKKAAKSREMGHIGRLWLEVINEVVNTGIPSSSGELET